MQDQRKSGQVDVTSKTNLGELPERENAAWDALVSGASRRDAGRVAGVSATTICNWITRWRENLEQPALFAPADDSATAAAIRARWPNTRWESCADTSRAAANALRSVERALSAAVAAESADEAKRWADASKALAVTFGILTDKADRLGTEAANPAEAPLSHEEQVRVIHELAAKLRDRQQRANASGQKTTTV